MTISIPHEVQAHFERGELVAAVAQDAQTGEVLMLAWMNQAALKETIATSRGVYWSRSRNALWIKGETSGHTQEVVDISYDCDGDAILLKVNQLGAACHTGERTCFYRRIENEIGNN